MPFNINQFNSVLTQFSGVQKPAYYIVDIPVPQVLLNLVIDNSDAYTNFNDAEKTMQFLCQASILPGVVLMSEDVRRYGYGPVQKKPFISMFTDISLTFIGDGEGYVWQFFHTWLKYINNTDSRQGMNGSTGIGNSPSSTSINNPQAANTSVQYPYEMNYIDDYAVDTNITALKPTGDTLIGVTLQKSWPVGMSDIPLAWDDQNGYVKIPVTLTYFDFYNNNQILPQGQSVNQYQGATGLIAPSSIITPNGV